MFLRKHITVVIFFFKFEECSSSQRKKKSAHNVKLYDKLIDAFQNVKYDICKHCRSYSDKTIFCFIFTSINYILNYEQLSAMTAVMAIFFLFPPNHVWKFGSKRQLQQPFLKCLSLLSKNG